MTENEKLIMETSERSKSNTHRLDELVDRVKVCEDKVDDIHTIATSIQLISKDMNYMRTDIADVKTAQSGLKKNQEEMKSEIVELKSLPNIENAKKWTKAISYVCTAIGSGVLMFLLAQLFPLIFGNK